MNQLMQRGYTSSCVKGLVAVIQTMYQQKATSQAPSVTQKNELDLHFLLELETTHFQAYQAGLVRWSVDDFDELWIPYVWEERFSRDAFQEVLQDRSSLCRLLVSLPAHPTSQRTDQWEAWIRKLLKASEAQIMQDVPLMLYFLLTPSHRIKHQLMEISALALPHGNSNKDQALFRRWHRHPDFLPALQSIIRDETNFLATTSTQEKEWQNPVLSGHAMFLHPLFIELSVCLKEKILQPTHQTILQGLWSLITRIILSCPDHVIDSDWSAMFRCAQELTKPMYQLAAHLPSFYRGPVVTRSLRWCPTRYPLFKHAYYSWLREYLPGVMHKGLLETVVIETFGIWLQDEERSVDLSKYEIKNLLSSVLHSEYVPGPTSHSSPYYPHDAVKQEGEKKQASSSTPRRPRKVAHRSRSRGRSQNRQEGSSSEEEGDSYGNQPRRSRSKSRKRRQSDYRAEAESDHLRSVLAERNARSKGMIPLPGPAGSKRPRLSRSKSRTRT